MAGELRSRSLPRRSVLLGVTAIAANALAAACGSNVPVTPAATAIPAAGTRLASNLATTTVSTEAAVPFPVPQATVGTTLATTTASPTAPLVVFIGGSIPLGFGLPPSESFPAQTIALLSPTKYDAVNLSMDGLTIDIMSLGASGQIDPLYAASRHKNVVVLFSGSNDLASGRSAAEAVAQVVTFSQARRSVGFKVVIATILPRTGYLTGVTPGAFESERQGYNARVRQNLASVADALADVAADPMIGAAGATANRTYYQNDEVDPTSAGHRIIAEIVKAAILTL